MAPYGDLTGDARHMIDMEYLVQRDIFKDPRNMQKEDIVDQLKHIHARQVEFGPEDAFRFKQYKSGRDLQPAKYGIEERPTRRKKNKGKKRSVPSANSATNEGNPGPNLHAFTPALDLIATDGQVIEPQTRHFNDQINEMTIDPSLINLTFDGSPHIGAGRLPAATAENAATAASLQDGFMGLTTSNSQGDCMIDNQMSDRRPRGIAGPVPAMATENAATSAAPGDPLMAHNTSDSQTTGPVVTPTFDRSPQIEAGTLPAPAAENAAPSTSQRGPILGLTTLDSQGKPNIGNQMSNRRPHTRARPLPAVAAENAATSASPEKTGETIPMPGMTTRSRKKLKRVRSSDALDADPQPPMVTRSMVNRKRVHTADDLARQEAAKYGVVGKRRRGEGNQK